MTIERALPCVWGCLTLSPLTGTVVGVRGCHIAQVLPTVIKHLRGWKKGLRPPSFYFMLYLPILTVLWAVLSFGIQGWLNPKSIFPCTMTPVALIGLFRDVKQGWCTYSEARDVLKERYHHRHHVHWWTYLRILEWFELERNVKIL